MKVHIGQIIKGVITKKGIRITDFARKVNYSRRNIYILFTKESIDTLLLEKIGKILDYNFFQYYYSASLSDAPAISFLEPDLNKGYSQKNRPVPDDPVTKLKEEVNYLKEINSLLKEKLTKKRKRKK